MAGLTPAELLHKLNWRYATKKFDPAKEIPAETWKALEQVLILTPSSYGLQPWKFFVVKDKDLRAQLKVHSWNQDQITDASHLVVLASKENLSAADVTHFTKRIAQTRGIPEETLNTYKNMMVNHVQRHDAGFNINEWATRQVYIALGSFLTAAAVLDIDACPMEGFDPLQYNRILNLNGYYARCVIAAGFRAANDAYAKQIKVRFPASEMIAHL